MNKHITLLLPKYPSLAEPVTLPSASFVEDRNAAVITFSFFKGSSSQVSQPKVLCGYLATTYVAIIQQSRKSLEILSSHSWRLWVDSQLFSTFDCLFSGRGGTSAPDQKVFLIGLLSPIQILQSG